MPTTSSNDDSKGKQKLPNGSRTSIANRDKPLFTSKRRPQLQQDFTTESLNTTFIPSPSPSKSENRSPTLAKPRQAHGHTRGFSAALKAIEERKEGHGSQNDASSWGKGKSSKSISFREDLEASPSPSPKAVPIRSGTRTPSPPRGRALPESLVSPTSDASSPPRGLAEAYQRINDEEVLAALEGNSENSEDEAESEVLQDITNERNLGIPSSPSPSPRRTSKRDSSKRGSSKHRSDDLQYHTTPAVDDTQSSRFSNLSEDFIPDEDRKSLPPSRLEQDQQRVSAALAGDAQPFRKAKRRSGLTLGGLRRDDASSQSGSSSFGSSQTGSILSDPALNIPQGWGRKARHGRTWLNRINGDKADPEVKKDSKKSKTHQDDEKLKSIEDWQATAASTPLPPVAESDSSRRESPQDTREDAAQVRSKASRDRVRWWEQGENGMGWQYQSSNGSPARIRNPTIDMIRDREIQNLNRSAVTTNRLGELKEQRSLERVGRRSASNSSESLQARDADTESLRGEESAKVDRTSPDERDALVQSIERSSSNEIRSSVSPDLPVAISHSRSSTPTLDDSNGESTRALKKESSTKNDTRDVLKALSRVASPDVTTRAESTKRSESQSPQPQASRPETKVLTSETQLLPEKDKNSQEPATKPKPVENTPQPSKANAYVNTPLVTGAWIDTPLSTTNQRRPSATSELLPVVEDTDPSDEGAARVTAKDSILPIDRPRKPERPLEETAPKLPKSALNAIIDRAKEKKKAGDDGQNDDTLQLDDSTIESLEELLASSEGELPSSSPPTPPDPGARDVPRSSVNRSPAPQTRKIQKQRNRNLGEEYNHVTSKLIELQSSISNAKQDLTSIQKKIKKRPAKDKNDVSRSISQSGHESECSEAGEIHDFLLACEKCGHGRGNGIYNNPDGSILEWKWRPVQVPIPRLWFWPEGWKTPRLTRLGWWTTIAFALVVVALILERAYTPPFFARRMEGFGVDYNAPRPPFILPKLFWRHGLRFMVEPVCFALQVIIRFIAGVFGLSAGIFEHPSDRINPAAQSNPPKWIFQPGVVDEGAALGMDADEYL